MGMFMQSVSFRRPPNGDWRELAQRIRVLIESHGQDADSVGLEEDRVFYSLISPFGDMGPSVVELSQSISELTGDYAIQAECVDSDFNFLTLYYGGQVVDAGCNGNPYEEFAECGMNGPLHPEKWYPLLLEPEKKAELDRVLLGKAICAEDLLKDLTALTGFPIFDHRVWGD